MYMTLTDANKQNLLNMAKSIAVRGTKEFVKEQGWTVNDEEQCDVDELEGKGLKKAKKVMIEFINDITMKKIHENDEKKSQKRKASSSKGDETNEGDEAMKAMKATKS